MTTRFSKSTFATIVALIMLASGCQNQPIDIPQTPSIKLWDKTFGGKFDEYFEAVAPTSDGGFLLGGYSNSIISGDKSQDVIGDLDYWVVKIK